MLISIVFIIWVRGKMSFFFTVYVCSPHDSSQQRRNCVWQFVNILVHLLAKSDDRIMTLVDTYHTSAKALCCYQTGPKCMKNSNSKLLLLKTCCNSCPLWPDVRSYFIAIMKLMLGFFKENICHHFTSKTQM